VRRYKLPPDLQGKAIADGPLPFVFTTDAKRLKQRYFMRVVTPPDVDGQVWIEAYPRYQRDAAEFSKVEVILQSKDMTPYAIQLTEPNKKDRKVYQFQNVVINPRWRLFGGNSFNGSLPLGWRWLDETDAQPQRQANRASPSGK